MKTQKQEAHFRPPRIINKLHPPTVSSHGKSRMFSRRLESRKGR